MRGYDGIGRPCVQASHSHPTAEVEVESVMSIIHLAMRAPGIVSRIFGDLSQPAVPTASAVPSFAISFFGNVGRVRKCSNNDWNENVPTHRTRHSA